MKQRMIALIGGILLMTSGLSAAAFAEKAEQVSATPAPVTMTPGITQMDEMQLAAVWTKALATNGKYGYVRETDLIACGPTSPDDTDWERRVYGNGSTYVIPVYGEDHETEIGEYVIQKAGQVKY
ncbi:MAG: hypothetical protein IJK64_09125 [Clostridia bacterium]|nr:hypothetical protein [Clostridia bacterium]